MPVSDTPRAKHASSLRSRGDHCSKEVVVGKNDVVIVINPKTGKVEVIDLESLSAGAPIKQSIPGTRRTGETVLIKRGKQVLRKVTFREIKKKR